MNTAATSSDPSLVMSVENSWFSHLFHGVITYVAAYQMQSALISNAP